MYNHICDVGFIKYDPAEDGLYVYFDSGCYFDVKIDDGIVYSENNMIIPMPKDVYWFGPTTKEQIKQFHETW
jgi:hypothetical protein